MSEVKAYINVGGTMRPLNRLSSDPHALYIDASDQFVRIEDFERARAQGQREGREAERADVVADHAASEAEELASKAWARRGRYRRERDVGAAAISRVASRIEQGKHVGAAERGEAGDSDGDE